MIRNCRNILLIDDHPYVRLDETTANVLTWALWELANHPAIQANLREEIRAARARAGSDLSAIDLDAMPYSMAVIKARSRDTGWEGVINTL